MISFKHVDGKDCGKIHFYGLSTCVWCRKTRQLLDKLGVAYDYVYVDLLSPADQEQAMEAVRRWNPERVVPDHRIQRLQLRPGLRRSEDPRGGGQVNKKIEIS